LLLCGIDSVGLVNRSDTRPPSWSYCFGKFFFNACCSCGWVNVTWLLSIAPRVLRVEQPTATRATSTTTNRVAYVRTADLRASGLGMINPGSFVGTLRGNRERLVSVAPPITAGLDASAKWFRIVAIPCRRADAEMD